MDADGNLACQAWPGGPTSPVCVGWATRERWFIDVAKAHEWVAAGQMLGPLADVPAVVADGVLAVRSEWDKVNAEERDRKR